LFVFQYVIAYLLYIVYSALHFVYHSNDCNTGWFMNSIIGIYLIWLVVAHVTILALAVCKHTLLCVCFLVWKYHRYGFSYAFCYGFTCWILHTVHLICGVTVHKFIWFAIHFTMCSHLQQVVPHFGVGYLSSMQCRTIYTFANIFSI